MCNITQTTFYVYYYCPWIKNGHECCIIRYTALGMPSKNNLKKTKKKNTQLEK